MDTPFLSLSAPLMRHARGADAAPAAQDGNPDHAARMERAERVFLAAVKAVQARLNHLSEETITHPPHGWSDAVLARQIAVHVSIRQLALPGYHLAEAYQRSRESLHRALHAVDDRIAAEPAFAEAYADIAQAAETHLAGDDHA